MNTNDLKKVLAGCCLAALLASASAGAVNVMASGSGWGGSSKPAAGGSDANGTDGNSTKPAPAGSGWGGGAKTGAGSTETPSKQ